MTVAREIALDDIRSIPDMSITDTTPIEEDSWDPINLGQIEERPPIKPTLGHGGIAYPGKRHVFSGPQESAKTLAAYAIALELVHDGDPVVIVDFEMGQWDARDRLRELGATTQDWQRIHYVEPSQQATPQRIERLLNLQPQLVLIDAAAGAYDNEGLDDNKRQDVERFTRLYVRDFWRAGIATIVLDHVVKNSETRGKYAIGSERKVGGADVHLGFEVVVPIKRGSTGIYKISTHKDRGGFLQRGRLADLHLTSHPETHHITWEFKPAEHTDADTVWMPTILMERASIYLEEQTEPVSFNTVITATKGKDSKVKEALEHLIALHYVVETEGSHSARLIQSTKPYRQENTPEQRPLPTSARLLPAEEEDVLCLPLPTSAPSTRGQGLAEEEAEPQEEDRPLPNDIDVYDPDIQALLDGDNDDLPL